MRAVKRMDRIVMQTSNNKRLNAGILSTRFRKLCLRALYASIAVLPFMPVARCQTAPIADYGPYNATFLLDGPGLTKTIAPPSPLDGRTTALLNRLGVNKQSELIHDSLLDGRAPWTLLFWFHAAEPLTDRKSTRLNSSHRCISYA